MDFLSFKSFISTEALIVFYYLGAIIFPVGLWLLAKWLVHKYHFIEAAHAKGKELIWTALNKKQKKTVIIFFIFCTLLFELFWRMLFEFLIAYMQMRDALLQSDVLLAH